MILVCEKGIYKIENWCEYWNFPGEGSKLIVKINNKEIAFELPMKYKILNEDHPRYNELHRKAKNDF